MKTYCLAVISVIISMAPNVKSEERPNILFLFADDLGRYASTYAQADGAGTVNDAVRTPNIDAIAEQGVLFMNAFVSAPSCTPCRSSLMSGQHFWRTGHGAILQGAIWDPSIPSWPLLLENNGYSIGFSYKAWSPGSPRDAPIGGDRTKHEEAGNRFNYFSIAVKEMVENGTTEQEAIASLREEVRGNFQSFLKSREPGNPFMYWFGPLNTHRAWVKGSGKALWNIDPDDLKGKLPPFLPDVHEVRQDIADYLGEAQAFDMGVGILLDELKKLDEYENTIIVISGDHGAPGFLRGKCNLYDFGTQVPLVISGPGIQGGRIVNDLVSLPDLAPTFLEAGQTDVPDVMTAKTLWPVLKSEKDGWVDPERTHVFIGRERHVRTARAGNMPYPQRAIRTKDYLLVINFKPERYPLGDPYQLDAKEPFSFSELENNTFITLADEDAGPTKAWIVTHRNDPKWQTYFEHAYGKRPRLELYDVKKDPFQMNNLAANPEYKEVVKRLEKRLMLELEETGDPRLVNGGSFFEEVGKFDN